MTRRGGAVLVGLCREKAKLSGFLAHLILLSSLRGYWKLKDENIVVLVPQKTTRLPTPTVGGQEGYKSRKKRLGHDKAMSYLQANVEYRLKNGLPLPTPVATDGTNKGGPDNPSIQRRVGKKQITLSMMTPGQLSPGFVGEMMGYPKYWTKKPFL